MRTIVDIFLSFNWHFTKLNFRNKPSPH